MLTKIQTGNEYTQINNTFIIIGRVSLRYILRVGDALMVHDIWSRMFNQRCKTA